MKSSTFIALISLSLIIYVLLTDPSNKEKFQSTPQNFEVGKEYRGKVVILNKHPKSTQDPNLYKENQGCIDGLCQINLKTTY